VWPDRDGPSPHASDGASRFARAARLDLVEDAEVLIDTERLVGVWFWLTYTNGTAVHVHLQGPQRLSQMRQRVVWVSGLPSVKLAGRTLAGVGRAPHSRPRPRVAPGVAPVPKWGT